MNIDGLKRLYHLLLQWQHREADNQEQIFTQLQSIIEQPNSFEEAEIARLHIEEIFSRLKPRHAAFILLNFINHIFPKEIRSVPFHRLLDVVKGDPEFEKRAVQLIIKAMIESDPNRDWMDRPVLPAIDSGEEKKMLSFFEHHIEDGFATRTWSEMDMHYHSYILEAYHGIAVRSGDLESFYLNCGLVLERFRTSNRLDVGENYLDHLVQTSYSEGLFEYGLHLRVKWHYATSNTLYALIVMAFMAVNLRKKTELNSTLLRITLEHWMELAGQSGYMDAAAYLYKRIHGGLPLNDYNRSNLDLKYFSILMSRGLFDDQKISQLIDSINNNPVVFKTGANLGLAYLSLVMAIVAAYPESTHRPELEVISTRLKQQVNDNDVNFLASVYEPRDARPLIPFLESLESALSHERSDTKITSVLRANLAIISSVHNISVATNDVEAYLTAIKFKTDYAIATLCSRPKTSTSSSLPPAEGTTVYLSTNFSKIFFLRSFNRSFDGIKSITTTYNGLKEFSERLDAYFEKGIKAVNKKEAERMFAGPVLPLAASPLPLSIIRDVWISNLPHNLLRNERGEFMVLSSPMADVISAEWLSNRPASVFTKPDIQCYIPIEASDPVILAVYNNASFQKLTQAYSIGLIKQTVPPQPLSSSINIVVAHGAKDIGDFFALSDGNTALINMDRLCGPGRLAILFVCNSGSSKMGDYSHKMASFIRGFFMKGYEAVIAPAWDLSTAVPATWLKEFLHSVYDGETVSIAHHRAIVRLHQSGLFIDDWACLHLYGNPGLKFNLKS